ncbi:class I SAM-dependent methyltransferase [Olleya aquimaris]|nr:class I SAM-dependent methyltransferase [Olleya aquimaris]
MIRTFIKKITHPFLKFFTENYFNKTRNYTYKNITVKVVPSVFPPHYTISTKILLDYISSLDLKEKTLLELGCGSGIISLFAASKNATVTASDINKNALNALKTAADYNKLNLTILYSDLFQKLQKSPFDVIIINPPYYPKNPKDIKENAWFCGEDFEYFKNLFFQLDTREDKLVLMILSQDCDLEKIKNIADTHNIKLECVLEKKVLAENNFIFSIKKTFN